MDPDKKIMFVTENKENAVILQYILTRRFLISVAKTKEESLKRLKKKDSIDLIVLDHKAPKMDIIKYFDHLRDMHFSLPIIITNLKENLIGTLIEGIISHKDSKTVFNYIGKMDYISAAIINTEIKNKIYKILNISGQLKA